MDGLRSKLAHMAKELQAQDPGPGPSPSPSQLTSSGASSVSTHPGEPNLEHPVLGLIQLWPDPTLEGVSNIPTEVDVIAIHGLGGHAYKTWRDGERLWLKDFLPHDAPTARILTFGYNASVAFTQSRSNIRDFGTSLLEQLRTFRRRNKETNRKMIFVCHSLGGIVFKQALVIAHEKESRYRMIEQSIAGVIFLGTPHRGAEVAYWSGLLAKFANTFAVGKVRQDLLKSLEPKSSELGTICSQFVERGMRLQIFSLYERHNTPGLGSLVVDEFSAILHLPNETPIPMETDHRGMCKFLTGSDLNYRTVLGCIEELMDSLAESSQHSYYDPSQWKFMLELNAIDCAAALDRITSDWTQSSRWFLDDPEFRSWTDPQGRQAMWLHGLPGCGKTVLMKSVTVFLSSESEDAASSVIRKPVFFFFDDKDPARKTSDSFVRSILDQILRDPRCSFVFRYLDGDLRKISASEDGLWKCLYAIVQRSRGIMFQVVVDALDEVLRHGGSIVDRLQQLLAPDMSGRVRLLVSHRKPPPYEFSYTICPAVIDMDNIYTKQNVDGFVRMKVRNSLQESGLSRSAGMAIEEKIIEKSRANFLYATLAWEQFSRGTTNWTRDRIQASLSRLDGISNDLVDFYCQLLDSISSRYRQKARVAFTVLRFCEEKISFAQLATLAALADLELVDQRRDLKELEAQAADFEAYLLERCGHLVKADDNAVEFVHLSIKDMFSASVETLSPENRQILSQFTVSASDGQSIMYKLCMKAMEIERRSLRRWRKCYGAMMEAHARLRSTFGKTILDRDEIMQLNDLIVSRVERLSRTGCLKYAIRNWIDHYAATLPDKTKDEEIVSFLCGVNGHYCYLLWFSLPTRSNGSHDSHLTTHKRTHLSEEPMEEVCLFRAIALGDFPRLVGAILRRGASINYASAGVTPLSWAIICQRRNSFVALLKNGLIQLDYGAYSHLKPLHYATMCDDPFYVEQLLEHPDANVNVMCTSGTPLHQAIVSKNIAAANLILSHPHADIWCKDEKGNSPYALAFRHPMWEPLLLKMFDKYAECDSPLVQEVSGSSQFLWAGVHGWTEMEERILREDHAQVFIVDRETKMNSLTHYAYFGRRQKLFWILDRLPAHGFPLRSASDRYDLLHLCASQGWEDAVHLLQRKYRLESLRSDHQGRNLLHWAMEHSWDLDRFDLSRYTASDLDSQDRDGLTPVHIAVSNRNKNALELLVASGASCILKDKNGMSAAHLAAHVGWRNAVAYFVDAGHGDLGRTRDGASLLHLVAVWFEGALVHTLVASKTASVNATDQHRRTPLHYASINDNESTMAALLEVGGKVDARDENGMTPLHEAIRCGSARTAKFLLEHGADFKAVDGFRQSCLHLSIRFKHKSLARKFIQLGLAANSLDVFGMNPLHRACVTGMSEHVEMLLRKGASFTTRNCHRRTPLDMAVEGDNADAIEVLISWLDRSVVRDRTTQMLLDRALVLAYQLEREKISCTLMEAGADVDRKNIQVRRLYQQGPTGESRWPLMLSPSRLRHVAPGVP